MIFKGIPFRVSRSVVDLPNFDVYTGARYPHCIPGKEEYICFGRLLPAGKTTDTSVRTEYQEKGTGIWLHAEPIASNGHSLTNMMYGTNGRVYLMRNNKCFSAVLRKN